MNAKKAKKLRRQARAETLGQRDRALGYLNPPNNHAPFAGSVIVSPDTTRARYHELKDQQ